MIDLTGVLARGRAAHEALMVDTVRIERRGEVVLDRLTGENSEGPRTLLYEGPARVKPENAGTREVTAGDREVVLKRYEIAVPWSAEPAERVLPGDPVTVLASPDERLAGLVLVVAAVQYSATATAWRITGEDQT